MSKNRKDELSDSIKFTEESGLMRCGFQQGKLEEAKEELEKLKADDEVIEPNLIETWCRDCVFATRQDKKQTGCNLNRLTLLENNGAKLERKKEEDGNEFFVIKERVCMACRNSDWANQNNNKNLETAVRAQMTVRTDVIIPMDGETASLEKFKTTIESIKSQELAPKNVVVVVYKDGRFKPSNFISQLKLNGFGWKVEYIIEKLADARFQRGYAIDMSLRNSNAPFYTVIEPGFAIPKTFLSDIDKAINDKGLRFSMLLPAEGWWNTLVVQRKVYDALAEYVVEDKEVFTPQEKILHFAETEGQTFMIKKVEDICRLQ